ncbi:unnamed protein product [Orchesella dallaii]|uniref:Uncharacterized protein n=1 Tax=Orchesella dallaii TaxID=48710 RepID=A0ABP1RYP3_9HEXA
MYYPQQPFPYEPPQPQLSSTPSQVQPGVYYPAAPATVSYPQYTGPPPQFAGGVGQPGGGFTRNDRRFAIAGVSCVTIIIVVLCLLSFIVPIVIIVVMSQKAGDKHPDKNLENLFNRTPTFGPGGPWGRFQFCNMSYQQQQVPPASPQSQLSSTPSQVQPGVYYPAGPAAVSYPQYTGPPPQIQGAYTTNERRFAMTGLSLMIIIPIICCLIVVIIIIVLSVKFSQEVEKQHESFNGRTPWPPKG